MTGGERLERRPVVALFVDVAGFTSMVETQDPEDVRDRMTEAFTRIKEIVTARGGVIEKYIGDAALALFGARRAHRDDVDRAVQAAWDISLALGSFAPPLPVRAGVELGELLVDLARLETARDLMVVGDAVNVAARLQQLAEPGQIMIGPEAAKLTSATLAPAALHELKGKALPLSAAAVIAQPPAVGPPHRVPLVGREAELRALDVALHQAAAEGRPRVVVVVGDPGTGKSRLVTAFASRVEAVGATVRTATCHPLEEQQASTVLRSILEPDLAGADPLQALAANHGARSGEGNGSETAELIGTTAGLLAAGVDTSSLLWPGRVSQAKVAWRAYLRGLSAPSLPPVLIIDDSQWMATDVSDVLRVALSGLDVALLVVLIAWEPSSLALWSDAFASTVIDVPALTHAEASRLATLLGVAGEDVEHLATSAEGNPLYLETMAGGQWYRAEEMPLGVRAAVTARLDALDPALAPVVGAAALLAPRITVQALAAVLGVGADDVATRCGRLAQEHILFRAEEGYQFGHSLMGRAALAAMTHRDRRRLHDSAARWLDAQNDADPADLARHLDGADRGAEAVDAYQRAVERSMGRLALHEAEVLSRRAAELVDATGDAPTRAAVWLARGHVLFACGRLPDAQAAFTTALEAGSDGPEDFRSRALAGRATARFWQFDPDAAEGDALEAIALAGSSSAAGAEGNAALALVRSCQGRPGEAIQLAGLARDQAVRSGLPRLGAMVGTVAVLTEHHAGHSARAAALLPTVAAECRREGQPGPLTWALFKGGLAQAGLGDYDAALQTWDDLIEVAAATDSAGYACEVKNCFAHVARELGEQGRADDLDEACLSEAAPLDAFEAAANAMLNLAASALIAGDLAGARRRLADAQPLLGARSFYRWRYGQRYRHYHALVLEADGHIDEAIALAEESLVLGRQAGEGKNVLRPELQLAALHAPTDPAEASRRLRDVALRAEAGALRPIAWRAWLGTADVEARQGHGAEAASGRRAAVRVLEWMDRRVPDERRDGWRRAIASPIEEGDTSRWRLPL